jgi:hypothetical protein
MFMQLLCTAALLAFIGVLLSVSAARALKGLPSAPRHSVSPKALHIAITLYRVIIVIVQGRR